MANRLSPISHWSFKTISIVLYMPLISTTIEENINFHDVKEINISNTANKYVYLITIFLKDGREYSIKGRDQYEMNKVVRLINEKIGYKALKEELAKA
jgi:hypothetical protein